MSYDIKQVIVVRKDLNMRKGKIAAQVAHASGKVFFDRMQIFGPTSVEVYWTEPMLRWLRGSFAKIVVSVDSEFELFKLKEEVEKEAIVHSMILDNGATEFKETCPACEGLGHDLRFSGPENICTSCGGIGKVNKPTYTCLAIGPDYSERIDLITKNLKLL